MYMCDPSKTSGRSLAGIAIESAGKIDRKFPRRMIVQLLNDFVERWTQLTSRANPQQSINNPLRSFQFPRKRIGVGLFC